MYKAFIGLVTAFWIADIINLPFMETFDTTYQLNFWFWLLFWIFVPSTRNGGKEKKDD